MPVVDAVVAALLNAVIGLLTTVQSTLAGVLSVLGQIGGAFTQLLTFLYQFAGDVKGLLQDGFAGSWDWFKAIYSGVEGIFKGLDPITRALLTIIPLLTTLTAAFNDPEGAVNAFMCLLVDIIVGTWWPSTPNEWKIGFVLNNFISTFPEASYFVTQTFEGIGGILAITLLFKAIKLLPFF